MGLLSQKHFIGIEDYNAEDLQKIIDTGYIFREILERPIKKVPSLTGKNIVNLFLKILLGQNYHLNWQKRDCQLI